jgi:hypothetical protein
MCNYVYYLLLNEHDKTVVQVDFIFYQSPAQIQIRKLKIACTIIPPLSSLPGRDRPPEVQVSVAYANAQHSLEAPECMLNNAHSLFFTWA